MREINPKETTRAYAFEMWMQAPNPMVTFFKTLNVSPLLKVSRKKGLKFNMLMCYCIGRAANAVKESDILALLQRNYIPAFMHENRENLLSLYKMK